MVLILLNSILLHGLPEPIAFRAIKRQCKLFRAIVLQTYLGWRERIDIVLDNGLFVLRHLQHLLLH